MTEKECCECQVKDCAYRSNGVTRPGQCGRYIPKRVTNLDWIKAPERTAEEIVDFLSQTCTPEAMAAYCDQFESCRDCKASWLRSARK